MEIKFIVSFKWQKRSTKHPLRGLVDDGEAMDTKVRKTKAQKLIHLELFLGHIANYCPIIARNTIVKNKIQVLNLNLF